MRPKIVVVGSANTDMIVQVEHLPSLGETVLGSGFATVQGGKGANQAVGAARLGADVTFIARLGLDDFGKRSFRSYQDEGIYTEYITWDETAATGVALITVGKSGENTIAVAPGANLRLTPQNVLAAEKAIRAADYVLLQLEVPMETVLTAARLAKFHQVPVVLNPAPAAELPPELISLVDMLTPNETELAILSGCESTVMFEDEARRYIADSGLNTLVVTMGSKGVFALHHGEEWNLPAYPVQVVDTTAAGDAFNAALVVALSDKVPMESALRFASAAAAISVTRQGAQTSLPNKEELQKFLSRRVVSR